MVGWIRAARPTAASDPRDVRLPVRYDGADLADVAAATGLTVDDVTRLHTATHYDVVTVGALPGQPFLSPNDPALQLPRRPNPRVVLPAHTVAIAMHLTTVYPTSSPGGWNILGTALQALYDPHRPEPFLLTAGDRVRLVPSDGVTPSPISPVELLPPAPPAAGAARGRARAARHRRRRRPLRRGARRHGRVRARPIVGRRCSRMRWSATPPARRSSR